MAPVPRRGWDVTQLSLFGYPTGKDRQIPNFCDSCSLTLGGFWQLRSGKSCRWHCGLRSPTLVAASSSYPSFGHSPSPTFILHVLNPDLFLIPLFKASINLAAITLLLFEWLTIPALADTFCPSVLQESSALCPTVCIQHIHTSLSPPTPKCRNYHNAVALPQHCHQQEAHTQTHLSEVQLSATWTQSAPALAVAPQDRSAQVFLHTLTLLNFPKKEIMEYLCTGTARI